MSIQWKESEGVPLCKVMSPVHTQTLDERLDVAMSTLAAAEERLSLADHDGMQLMQQRDEALHRCAMPESPSFTV